MSGQIYQVSRDDNTTEAVWWSFDQAKWLPLGLQAEGGQSSSHLLQMDGIGNDAFGVSSPFVVFRAPGDGFPRLYSSVFASIGIPLAVLEPNAGFYPLEGHSGRPTSLGDLLVWQDCLVGADVGSPRLWLTEDPRGAMWEVVGNPDWESRGNQRVTHLVTLATHLYVAMENPTRGCEVWRCVDPATNAWEPIVTEGAFRFRRNPLITAVAVDKSGIYLGAGHGNPDPFGRGRPVGFELLGIDPVGGWSLLAGDCRFTPQGLRVPLWAYGPGLGYSEDPVVQDLAVWNGSLYVFTARRRVWRITGIGDCKEIDLESNVHPNGIVIQEGIPMLIGSMKGNLMLQKLAF